MYRSCRQPHDGRYSLTWYSHCSTLASCLKIGEYTCRVSTGVLLMELPVADPDVLKGGERPFVIYRKCTQGTICRRCWRFSTEFTLQVTSRSLCWSLSICRHSAAFDTADHEVQLQRLQSEFGVTDTPLSWFRSYLESRTQFVKLGEWVSRV